MELICPVCETSISLADTEVEGKVVECVECGVDLILEKDGDLLKFVVDDDIEEAEEDEDTPFIDEGEDEDDDK